MSSVYFVYRCTVCHLAYYHDEKSDYHHCGTHPDITLEFVETVED